MPTLTNQLLPVDADDLMKSLEQLASIRPRDRAENRTKILIIDDAPAVRLTMSLHLIRHGFETIMAASGEAAMTLLERHVPHVDLVFCDISADSTVDGVKFLKWLVKKRIETLLLLASSDQANARTAREICARAEIVSKPYDIDDVVARVSALTSNQRRGYVR